MQIAEFMAMDGYALYVWGAYAIAVTAFGGIMAHAVIRLRRLKKQDRRE